jgi:hypothetical protein
MAYKSEMNFNLPWEPSINTIVYYNGRPYKVITKVGIELLRLEGVGFKHWPTVLYWEVKEPDPRDLAIWRMNNG